MPAHLGALVMEIDPIIIAAAGVLGTVIVALWRHLWTTIRDDKAAGQKRHAGVQKRLDACQVAHESTLAKMIELAQQVGHLEGANDMSNRILAKIDEALTKA